jgi:murein DD-endopeptidase MepM/ murein hydrolase activator NlpD
MSVPVKRRHRKYLRILIVPDDRDEPKTFSIPIQRIKYIKALVVIVILHFIIGFFSYYQVYRISKQNTNLLETNAQLRENNKRVLELEATFKDLETSQTKIKAALGLSNSDLQKSSPPIPIDDRAPQIIENEIPRPETKTFTNLKPDSAYIGRLGFLTSYNSDMHNFSQNIPTLLPVEKGLLTADYETDDYSGRTPHRGIDIAAPRGTLVRAAADGIVVFSGFTYDLGNLLIIYHGAGLFTYYGHNQRLLVARNAVVKKGTFIALLGNSGISSAPHLHFEIWKDGIPLDPKDYLLAFSTLQ